MARYGNDLKKCQIHIPWEIHPDFCNPKIFAEFKGATQVAEFCCKIHLSRWWFICAWLRLFVFCFFVSNSGQQSELNISEFSNSSVDSPQTYELLLCFWKPQCLGDSSWRGFWQKEVSRSSYKNTWCLWLKRHWYSSAFVQAARAVSAPLVLSWRSVLVAPEFMTMTWIDVWMSLGSQILRSDEPIGPPWLLRKGTAP